MWRTTEDAIEASLCHQRRSGRIMRNICNPTVESNKHPTEAPVRAIALVIHHRRIQSTRAFK
ncbi:hypothetical protein Mapa_006636 [Marchantia paleacea]|nr:hypothetical protein Mapa_006636 [Marchantia paleacea]